MMVHTKYLRLAVLEKTILYSINRKSQSSDQANRDSSQNHSNVATNKTNKKPLNQ